MGSLSAAEDAGLTAEGKAKRRPSHGVGHISVEVPQEADSKGKKHPGFSFPPALHLPSVPTVGQMQIEAT